MVAATSVARARPSHPLSRARKTRPPSIGKAGIRLNTASTTFVARTCQRNEAGEPMAQAATPTTPKASAIATLTAGPASAIRSSGPAERGIRSSRATPPNR